MNIQKVLRAARVISWSYRILSTASGLVVMRLINDSLGLSGYGQLAFFLAFVGGISAVDLGVLQSISRFVARYEARPRDERGPFWATCVLLALGLFVLQALLIGALVVVLDLSHELRGLSAVEVLAVGLVSVTANLLTISSAVYAGWQQYGAAGIAKIGRALTYVLGVTGLWMAGHLDLRTALWANVLSALLPNLALSLWLLVVRKDDVRWSWAGYPQVHQAQSREILAYSLRGWLFTASTLVVSSGSVFIAGFMLAPEGVAKLQIGLVLYTGVAAFVTGSMAPLTTIRSRLSDGGPESRARVAAAACSVIEEAIVMAAMLTGFFVCHIDPVLRTLLGTAAADPRVLAETQRVVLTCLVPGLLVLPWFALRFALVEAGENARYSRRVLMGTTLALAVGAGVSALVSHPLGLAAGVGAALAYRGTLAFANGRHIVPGLSHRGVVLPMGVSCAFCLILGALSRLVPPGWAWGPASGAWLGAVAYLVVCAMLFVGRHHLRPAYRLRLGDDAPPPSTT